MSSIADDHTPLPPPAATEEEDDILLQDEPYIDAPITKVDYGFNVKYVFQKTPRVSAETHPY